MGKNNKRRKSGGGGLKSVTVTYTVYQAKEPPIQRACELELPISNPFGRGGAIKEAKQLALPEIRQMEGDQVSRVEINHIKIVS